jgi:hypothetical protein
VFSTILVSAISLILWKMKYQGSPNENAFYVTIADALAGQHQTALLSADNSSDTGGH